MKAKTTILSLLLLLVGLFGSAQNPFQDIGIEAKPLTLSKGKYQEFFDNDSVVRIGNTLFNVFTERIVGFVEEDTLYDEATLKPEVVSRWLSTDPLAEEYAGWSPYNYTLNNPINLVDPNGQLPIHPKNKAIVAFVLVNDIDVYNALEGSNNTSIHHLNEYAKGRGQGNERNLIGAFGEANALQSLKIQPLPWAYKTFFNNDYKFGSIYKGNQIDIHHTIETGNWPSKDWSCVEGFYALINHGFGGGLALPKVLSGEKTWNVLYEVKTINPYNPVEFNFNTLSSGIDQTIKRGGSDESDSDVGVLMTDKQSWNNVANDPVYGPRLKAKYQELIDSHNCLRLDDGLYDRASGKLKEVKEAIKTISD